MKPLLFIALCLSAASAGYAQTDDNNTSGNGSCFNVPISVSGESREVTITPKSIPGSDNVYIYYHQKKVRHHFNHDEFNDLGDANASKPILLNRKEALRILPNGYKVTVTSPDNTVTACKDSTLNLNAGLNVEEQSEFSGNYPSSTKKSNYVVVSKKTYKKASKKLAHLEKKEKKVARATGVTPRGV